jgi:hypothetical protein
VRSRTAKGNAKLARRAAPLALLLVLVHLGGTVGGYLHFALIEHERCPEHGELIHAPTEPVASGHGDAHRDAGSAASPDTSSDASLLPSRGLSDGSHDPCALTTALRERAAAPEPGVSSVSQPLVGGLPSLDDHRDFAARAGYRLAPKTSPPAHA